MVEFNAPNDSEFTDVAIQHWHYHGEQQFVRVMLEPYCSVVAYIRYPHFMSINGKFFFFIDIQTRKLTHNINFWHLISSYSWNQFRCFSNKMTFDSRKKLYLIYSFITCGASLILLEGFHLIKLINWNLQSFRIIGCYVVLCECVSFFVVRFDFSIV